MFIKEYFTQDFLDAKLKLAKEFHKYPSKFALIYCLQEGGVFYPDYEGDGVDLGNCILSMLKQIKESSGWDDEAIVETLIEFYNRQNETNLNISDFVGEA